MNPLLERGADLDLALVEKPASLATALVVVGSDRRRRVEVMLEVDLVRQ